MNINLKTFALLQLLVAILGLAGAASTYFRTPPSLTLGGTIETWVRVVEQETQTKIPPQRVDDLLTFCRGSDAALQNQDSMILGTARSKAYISVFFIISASSLLVHQMRMKARVP